LELEKGQLLRRGKVKALWATADPGLLIAQYSDAITAGDGAKRAELPGKGALLNKISAILFHSLTEAGVANHLVGAVGETASLVRKAESIKLEVVVRNSCAGSICRRLAVPQGQKLAKPLVEFFYKEDSLGDPLLTEEHIQLLNLASRDEIQEIKAQALAVNQVLMSVFAKAGLDLVDFKLEFGRLLDGTILLIDEISPDTCRLWRRGTMEGLDKDRFRKGTGDVLAGYREVLQRLKGGTSNED
jgi:phosphoribosylaminoimidazole-succinocarboxamide synthase